MRQEIIYFSLDFLKAHEKGIHTVFTQFLYQKEHSEVKCLPRVSPKKKKKGKHTDFYFFQLNTD